MVLAERGSRTSARTVRRRMGHLRGEQDSLSSVTEITLAMIDAGYEALCMFDSECGDVTETAVKVYKAMEAARRSFSSKCRCAC